MSNNSVNFKFGSTIKDKTIDTNDLVVINEGLAEGGNDKFGAVYKGNKMVGTTKADSLYTTGDITIAGGPMETMLKTVYPDGKIPAGTSMQELFMALACVEKWPTNAKVNYTELAVAFNSLSNISIVDASNNAPTSLMEYGTPLTIANYTGSSAKVTTTPKISYSGFTWGYSDKSGYKGTATSSETNPPAVTGATPTRIADSTVTLSRSMTGFVGSGTLKTSDSASSGSDITINGETVTVSLGTNELQFSQIANVNLYTGSVSPTVSTYYALSNLGNTDKNNAPVKTITAETKSYNKKPADVSSNKVSVTGVWPVYSNIKSGAFTADATSRYTLQTSNVFEFIDTPTEVGSANNFMFDYPATFTVSKFEMKDPSGNWVAFAGSYTAASEPFNKTVQGVERSYKRLTTAGGNGSMKYRITLNKSLDKE